MPTFIRTIRMTAADPARLAVRDEHRAYVADLHARGEIRMSGPFVGDEGAMIVYEAADRDAAQALVDADPYTREGVVDEVALIEWTVIVPSSN